MRQPLTDKEYDELRQRGETLTIRAAQLVEQTKHLHADIADYTQLITGEAWLTFIRPDQSAQKPAACDCAQVDES